MTPPPPPPPAPPPPVDTGVFVEEAKAVVGAVRRALADALVAVNGDPAQPQEISRRFGLDKTLTWKIARVIREDDPWEAVAHIPRRPSIRILIGALAKHGLGKEHADPLWQAMEGFEQFIETHSGDRETLEMMASPAAKRSASKRLELFRKSGFQANSALFGVQARVQLAMQMVTPNPHSEEMLDLTTVCGLMDFRRLRANVPWAIATLSGFNADDAPRTDTRSGASALERALPPGTAPILSRFCSQPALRLREIHVQPGVSRYELTEGPIGNTAAVDAVLGWRYVGTVSKHAEVEGEHGEHTVVLSTPVETLIHDLWVHRSLAFAMNPTAHIYSMLPGGPRYPQQGRHVGLLPVPAEVTDLGTNPPDTTTPELPRYREMAELAASENGCRLEDFRAYRFRVKFPPIPAMGVLRHGLLAARK